MSMQRPGRAARRFYNAFYQWALLTLPKPECSEAPRQLYHSSKCLKQEIRTSEEQPLTHGHTVPVPCGWTPKKTSKDRELRTFGKGFGGTLCPSTPAPNADGHASINYRDAKEHGHASILAAWPTTPVQSSIETPCTSLLPWTSAVRHRSNSRTTLEYAIPKTRDVGSSGAQAVRPAASRGYATASAAGVSPFGVGNHIGSISEETRTVLRALTHPVVLITTREPSLEGLDASRGVTVSSFNTVTLRPRPIISFNLKLPSRTWEAILASDRMCVHVLAASPGGAAIAHAFTQGHKDPAHAFHFLQRAGVKVQLDDAVRVKPPRLQENRDVLATLEARLVREKCIEIRDHMVVVGEVSRVDFDFDMRDKGVITDVARRAEGPVGLAYAQREYRTIGDGIKAQQLGRVQPPGVASEDDTADTKEHEVAFTQKADVEAGISSENDEMPRRSGTKLVREDMITDHFSLTEHEVENVDTVAALSAERDITRHRADTAEEDNSDLLCSSQEPNNAALSRPQAVRHAINSLKQAPKAIIPKKGAARSTAKHGSKDAWGVPSLTRDYGTHSRLLRFDCTSTPYSTASTDNARPLKSQYDSGNATITKCVIDQSLLKVTVGDFLGLSVDEPNTTPRMAGLVRLRRASELASSELSDAMADGTLTEEQSLRLESTIAVNERKIAKTLALHSAKDLRRMLDKGKVDVKRAQWLEQSIEKGQVAILEEARQVRQLFDQGGIDERQFRMLKQRLQGEHQVLNTEAMRLRDVSDEDEDYGVSATAAEPHSSGQQRRFDGFDGNV